MTARFLHLGFEIGGDPAHRIPVTIPIRHMAVTGQTQESGKTTALTALISRSGLPAIAFITKRGEGEMPGRRILPFFQERADWPFVQSILESTMKERMKFERAWIVRACQGARTLADVQRNLVQLQAKAKNALSQDVYMLLGEYLQRVVPLLATLPKHSVVDVSDGLSVVDLVRYPLELQMLIISSTLDWIHKHASGVITVMPEAWKFVPEGRNTPVKISAENLAREGAGLRNYLWIDSQDMAGVHKMLLRACAVWLIGAQREANEIKRALANMGAQFKKPKAADVATLELGQFFACFGKEIRKTYVQPAWMNETVAHRIASGRLSVHEVAEGFLLSSVGQADGAPRLATAETKPPAAAHESVQGADFSQHSTEEKEPADQGVRAGTRVAGEFPLGSPRTGADSPVAVAMQTSAEEQKKEDMMADASALHEILTQARNALDMGKPELAERMLAAFVNGTVPAAPAPRTYTPQESLDNEQLYQAFKARLIKEAPALIRLTIAVPEIEVQKLRRTIAMNDDTIKGRVATLIAVGWFDQPRAGSETYKELLRRGLAPKTPSIRVYEALSEFRSFGFFHVTEDKKYHVAPGAKVNIVEAA